ncbi:probable 6-phosphogluconolactonase 4, chloroplastic [Abrus precatorius]|uniref:Probable 6-phosphogluconolactonase n=1 Tax=Abrus precatorius TaxID=3816 RepID=A0A8B8K7D0_ABRPR|nr:probable 6-phosphogluconolactonase 4, chloroplastic [Abrus precatorius]
MATSTFSSLSCTPQSRLLSNQKTHTPSPSMSLLSPQVGHKSLYHPLRHNVSPIPMMKPKRIRVGGLVKASMDNKNVEVFSKEHLAVSLAKYVADLSNKFIKERGYFTVALSSGSIKYLRKLVEPQYYNSIEWSKWHIFWVEEKVVQKTHVDSNYKLTYDGFISKVPIPPHNVNTIDDALPADGAADVYETTLRRLVTSNVIAKSTSGFPKFDLVLLDMGPDGHIASLFPGHPTLSETKKWVTFLKNAPTPPPERITFTLPVINESSNIAMVVTGAGKADAVYSALQEAPSDYKLPVQLVSPKDGEFKWFLDKGAASRLYR